MRLTGVERWIVWREFCHGQWTLEIVKRSDQAKGFHGDSPSYERPYAVDKPPPEAGDAYFATATGKE